MRTCFDVLDIVAEVQSNQDLSCFQIIKARGVKIFILSTNSLFLTLDNIDLEGYNSSEVIK